MNERSLVGTWRMVTYELRDAAGGVIHPLGADATGLLMFTGDGYFSGTIMAAGRERFASDDWLRAGDAEWVAAARGYVAYCGRYRVEDGELHNRAELSLFPNWIGGVQLRHIGWEGERLILTSDPVPTGGEPRSVYLIWERAESAPSAAPSGAAP